MKIAEIQVNQKGINIDAEVVSLGEPREFTKFGKPGKVANAIIKDDSGEIQLTLWNEQTEMLKPGDKIRISNAYVKEWQGEKQLNIGRFGSMEVIS